MKKSILDILFWIAMLVLIGYIIAKLTGFINTPEWVDLIPLVTITFLIGIFYQKVIGFINVTNSRTLYLKNKLEEHNKRLANLENK